MTLTATHLSGHVNALRTPQLKWYLSLVEDLIAIDQGRVCVCQWECASNVQRGECHLRVLNACMYVRACVRVLHVLACVHTCVCMRA